MNCSSPARFVVLVLHFIGAVTVGGGCGRSSAKQVVLYTSVDEPVARPIVRDFESKTGISVTLVTDGEATKGVGLAERLRAERGQVRADVWWGNEPFLTAQLADEGALAAYESPAAADVPQRFKDAGHRWASVGMRVRTLVIFKGPVAAGGAAPAAQVGLETLADYAFRNRVAIARPTAGTTGGHVAALYSLWGEERARLYFQALRDNGVKLLGGNSVVADSVGNGTMLVGLTDNDDAAAALGNGGKLRAVLPDQGADADGTLGIPTTVAVVAGAPHDGPAKQLVDYLLSRDVEQRLLAAKFAAYSVRPGGTGSVKLMQVDYAAAAKVMPQAVREATAIIEGRKP